MLEEYYNMADKTAYANRGLWFHTGDLGKMNEKGDLFFVRRKAECVRVSGNFCSTSEIERLICKNEDVIECAAYGVPDQAGKEEEIMVAVRVRDGVTVKCEDILKSLEDDVPYFMVPRYIRFVTHFEKTPTMRIVKKDLIKEGIVPNAWDRRKAGFKLRRS
jgi:crotonobetaine/carnitine-CoA ligase